MLIRTDGNVIYNTETGGVITHHSGDRVMGVTENGEQVMYSGEVARNIWAKLCKVADMQMDTLHMQHMKLQWEVFHNKEREE